MTYSDMTSGGKLRGISPALSHNALSLVHVQDEGQRGGLALLLSTTSNTVANTSTQSQGDVLDILLVFVILENRCGHGLRVEESYTLTGVSAVVPGGQATRCPVCLRASPPLSLEVIKPGAPYVHSTVITLHPQTKKTTPTATQKKITI